MPEVNFGFGEKFPIGGGAGPLLGQRDWFLRITSYRGHPGPAPYESMQRVVKEQNSIACHNSKI